MNGVVQGQGNKQHVFFDNSRKFPLCAFKKKKKKKKHDRIVNWNRKSPSSPPLPHRLPLTVPSG